MQRVFYYSGISLIVLLASLPSQADQVARGNYSVTVNQLSGSLTGSVTYDNQAFDVFGLTSVNLGTSVGSLQVVGSLSPFSGSSPGARFSNTGTSLVPGVFGRSVTGSAPCFDPACASGSFISRVTGIGGAVVGVGPGKLPPSLVYTEDGSSSCFPSGPTSVTCSGGVATNAFLPVPTPVSVPLGSPISVSSTAEYFDSFAGNIETVSVDVTYDSVTAPGQTTVTATSNLLADLPPGIVAFWGNFGADFIDITSSAGYSGDLTVCSTYPDADDDGIVDGTGQAGASSLPECSIRLLHDDGSGFADKTLALSDPDCPFAASNGCAAQGVCIDTEANRVCARTTSLSPFVVAVETNSLVPGMGPIGLGVLIGLGLVMGSRQRDRLRRIE